MQWSGEENAGFCSDCNPWLLPNPNFNDSNSPVNIEVFKLFLQLQMSDVIVCVFLNK